MLLRKSCIRGSHRDYSTFVHLELECKCTANGLLGDIYIPNESDKCNTMLLMGINRNRAVEKAFSIT